VGKKYQKTLFDVARDELFSHIQRCDVLEAEREDQLTWIEDTMEYLVECYPDLSPNDWSQLGKIAQRYLRPAVPHGCDATALNREEWQETAAA
jgi:hypothetical protein